MPPVSFLLRSSLLPLHPTVESFSTLTPETRNTSLSKAGGNPEARKAHLAESKEGSCSGGRPGVVPEHSATLSICFPRSRVMAETTLRFALLASCAQGLAGAAGKEAARRAAQERRRRRRLACFCRKHALACSMAFNNGAQGAVHDKSHQFVAAFRPFWLAIFGCGRPARKRIGVPHHSPRAHTRARIYRVSCGARKGRTCGRPHHHGVARVLVVKMKTAHLAGTTCAQSFYKSE